MDRDIKCAGISVDGCEQQNPCKTSLENEIHMGVYKYSPFLFKKIVFHGQCGLGQVFQTFFQGEHLQTVGYRQAGVDTLYNAQPTVSTHSQLLFKRPNFPEITPG